MFAIEGPTVINVAPTGIFSRTHSPASRPPGTPPVPAINFPVVEGRIIFTLEIKMESAIIRSVVVLIQLRRIRKLKIEKSSGHQWAIARPASTAIGGAIGSKYWK